jgi:hypothetical protein
VRSPCPPTGNSVALSVTSSSNYCTRWYTSVFQNHFFLAFTFATLPAARLRFSYDLLPTFCA